MGIMNIFRPKSLKKAIDDSALAGSQPDLPPDVVAQKLAKEVISNQSPTPASPALNNVNMDDPQMHKTLETCKALCHKLMTETGDKWTQIQKKWQEFYAGLNDHQKRAVWHYAERQLPHIREDHDRGFINNLWHRIFSNESIIRRITKGKLSVDQGYGLVYCYLVNGKIRYIGKTQEASFIQKLLNMQVSGSDYKDAIKRNLLNAYRVGQLEIQVQAVNSEYIDAYQQKLIERYAPTNRLWNEEYNSHFHIDNYNFSF